jgi:hypothetical protein
VGIELLFGWKCRSRVPLSFPSKICNIEWGNVEESKELKLINGGAQKDMKVVPSQGGRRLFIWAPKVTVMHSHEQSRQSGQSLGYYLG